MTDLADRPTDGHEGLWGSFTYSKLYSQMGSRVFFHQMLMFHLPSHITIYILSIINTQELIRRPSIQRELIAERENLLGKISEYVQNERKAFQVCKRGCTAQELIILSFSPLCRYFQPEPGKTRLSSRPDKRLVKQNT